MQTRNSKKRKLWETDLADDDELFKNPAKRRENDISYLINYLESIRDQRHDKKERRRREKPLKFINIVPNHIRGFVIFLRYGTITEPKEPVMTYKEVSKITGVKQQTCVTIVRAWKRNGFDFRNQSKGCPSNRKITPEIEKQLCNPKLLLEWCHLSLLQRCVKFEQKFGFKISTHTIKLYYNKNKISYINPLYSYQKKLTQQEELIKRQQEVALELATHIRQGKNLVYVDESTFHIQLVPSRVWVRPDM